MDSREIWACLAMHCLQHRLYVIQKHSYWQYAKENACLPAENQMSTSGSIDLCTVEDDALLYHTLHGQMNVINLSEGRVLTTTTVEKAHFEIA